MKFIIKLNDNIVVDGCWVECMNYINEYVGDSVWYNGDEISLGDCMETCSNDMENLKIDVVSEDTKIINIIIIVY